MWKQWWMCADNRLNRQFQNKEINAIRQVTPTVLGFMILLNTPRGLTVWQAQSQHFTCNSSFKSHNNPKGWALTFTEGKTQTWSLTQSHLFLKVMGWELEPRLSDAMCLKAPLQDCTETEQEKITQEWGW